MLRSLFYLVIVKPIVLLILGINARGNENLPNAGPAIIVANHNSHLDAMALMSLFSITELRNVYPVAAADYFLRNPFLKWFALNIIGIIPIERRPTNKGGNILDPVLAALDKNAILIIFPEGTRGEPEALSKFKNGIAHIVSERPHVPVVPVFFQGLGKCLPKGEFVLVPFFVDAYIGSQLHWSESRQSFMNNLETAFTKLQNLAKYNGALN